MVTFRKLLLNRCQREFEKDKSQEADFAQMKEEIEKAEGVSKVQVSPERSESSFALSFTSF